MATSTQTPHGPQAVAGIPRLFVGQVPTAKTEQDLLPLFAQFGEVESITLVRGPDNKSRGCAMVLFKRWTAAEAAVETLNATNQLEGSKGRPLVVTFANPRKATGQSGESAIAPKQLFVGQIPKHAAEADLASLFATFGEVEHLNVTEDNNSSQGQFNCGFVRYTKWAACEAAIDELHEQHVMPGSDIPLVVKFADAKPTTSATTSNHAHSTQQQHFQQQRQHFQQQQQQQQQQPSASQDHSRSLAKRPGSGGVTPLPTAFIPHPAMYPRGMYSMARHPDVAHHHMAMMPPGRAEARRAPGAQFSQPYPPAVGAMGSGGVQPGMPQGRRRGPPGTSSAAPSSRRGGLGGDYGSSDSLAEQSDASDGTHHHAMAPMLPTMHMPQVMAMHHDPAAAMAPHHYMPQMAAYMGPDGRFVGYVGMRPMLHSPGGKVGLGVVDPGVYAHKLFVGQVPFEASEQDLWPMFAPFGDILELALLRSAGVSKGCAFLTFASKQQALAAMSTLHGRQVSPNKRLVVKFANHKPSDSHNPSRPRMAGYVSGSSSS